MPDKVFISISIILLKYILNIEISLKVNSLLFNKLSYKIFIYINKIVENAQIYEILMHRIMLNKNILKVSAKKEWYYNYYFVSRLGFQWKITIIVTVILTAITNFIFINKLLFASADTQ